MARPTRTKVMERLGKVLNGIPELKKFPLTPDDAGALEACRAGLRPRARQNVVFEFGYFIGKLGRGRVCALVKGDFETPSDYDGVLYVPLDENDGWKMRLLRELKVAGFELDANQALSA